MENKLCLAECAAFSVTPSGVYSNWRAVRRLFGLFTWRNFLHPSIPALGLTQRPILWIPGHSRGYNGQGAPACNRNEYQEFFLGGKGDQSVRLTTLPPFASCPEIWEHQPSRTLRACPSLYRGLLYLILTCRTAWVLFAWLFCGTWNRNMAAGQFV